MTMKTAKIKNYKKKMVQKSTATGFVALASSVLVPTGVFADAKGSITEGITATGQSGGVSLEKGIENVTGVLLFLIGAIAVIAIIIGGIRYTTSNGDQGQIKSAKDTIMYACIGLVVAILAYAIVRWIVSAFGAK